MGDDIHRVVQETAAEAPLTREQRRSRRARARRAETISVKHLRRREIKALRAEYPEAGQIPLPETRSVCAGTERPCPCVGCKYHLYLDVSEKTGAIKLNFPDLEVWEMKDSCALDVADKGGVTLEEVGAIMNVTRERIRQVEVIALAKLSDDPQGRKLREYVESGPKVRLRVVQSEQEDEDDVDSEVSGSVAP